MGFHHLPRHREGATELEVKSPVGARLVLVLEEDARSADALATLLADWGYDCLHGRDVADMLPQVRRSDVFAIISDYRLSEGVSHAANSGVVAPALLLAGSVSGHAERQARAAGHSCLAKPARPESLKAWLDQLTVDVSH